MNNPNVLTFRTNRREQKPKSKRQKGKVIAFPVKAQCEIEMLSLCYQEEGDSEIVLLSRYPADALHELERHIRATLAAYPVDQSKAL